MKLLPYILIGALIVIALYLLSSMFTSLGTVAISLTTALFGLFGTLITALSSLGMILLALLLGGFGFLATLAFLSMTPTRVQGNTPTLPPVVIINYLPSANGQLEQHEPLQLVQNDQGAFTLTKAKQTVDFEPRS